MRAVWIHRMIRRGETQNCDSFVCAFRMLRQKWNEIKKLVCKLQITMNYELKSPRIMSEVRHRIIREFSLGSKRNCWIFQSIDGNVFYSTTPIGKRFQCHKSRLWLCGVCELRMHGKPVSHRISPLLAVCALCTYRMHAHISLSPLRNFSFADADHI